MKAILSAVAATLLLTSCAAQVISSSPRSVVIGASSGLIAESQSLADAECAKHQRFARLVKQPTSGRDDFLYDCVQ